MVAHVIAIETRPAPAAYVAAGIPHEHRWRCSCDRTGPWKVHALNVRWGAGRHVAAMERGKR